MIQHTDILVGAYLGSDKSIKMNLSVIFLPPLMTQKMTQPFGTNFHTMNCNHTAELIGDYTRMVAYCSLHNFCFMEKKQKTFKSFLI